MTLVRAIHHLRFTCKDVWKTYQTFVCAFGYKFHCLSRQENCLSLVVKNGPTLIALSEKANVPLWGEMNHCYPGTDGPFDVAFEVNNVHQICDRLRRLDGPSCILVEPRVHTDQHGTVTKAVIRSCVGDVVHTLLDTSNYRGLFLSGYSFPDGDSHTNLSGCLQPSAAVPATLDAICLDHIAMVCNPGDTDRILHWYSQVFEMNRVTCNESDNETEGILVKYGKTGLKLKTLDTGAGHVTNTSITSLDTCKFVIAESLVDSDSNQITRYLDVNNGPGIQHIALRISDIATAVQSARIGGAKFVDIPKEYYDEIATKPEFKEALVDLDKLRESAVLMDTEVLSSGENSSKQLTFLLQIFTEPLFERNGFFMELIDRRTGAFGFGVGNIASLWRAVETSSNPTQQSTAA